MYQGDETVEIVEVGPRDGLQNESVVLPTATKVELIQRLSAAGVRRIEAVSFVDPERVPQMGDAEALLESCLERRGLSLVGLVLNQRGLDRALATSIREVNVVLPVTDEFSWRNQGMGHEDLVRSVTEIVHNARATSLRISVTLSVAFGCPFAGEVPESVVISLAQRFANLGVHELAIADTIGVADPRAVSSLVRRMEGAIPLPALRVHFHDTRNTGIANVYAAFEAGVRVFDASVSGAGGCPFAPAASGNVATEDLAYLFHRMGVSTGLDHDAILETAVWLAERLGRPPQSALTRAGWFPSPS